MKKTGFTLAEVLVTLGIIGVVAALTTPALIQNVGNAKIPPKLAKAKATFENATEMMLVENSSNSILGVASTSEELGQELSGYMKINKIDKYSFSDYSGGSWYEGNAIFYVSDDGMNYIIDHEGRKTTPSAEYQDIPHNQPIGYLYVDVNGKQSPNKMGKDLFYFRLMNDGSLEPMGTRRSCAITSTVPPNYIPWRDHTSFRCNKDGVSVGLWCAGSIFENGMKIIYQ